MSTQEWLRCKLLETVSGKHSGDVVFKGTRLPVQTVVETVDAFMAIDHLPFEAAIRETLDCFDVPDGAAGIRQVLHYRAAHQSS